jgi:hypothetical protein
LSEPKPTDDPSPTSLAQILARVKSGAATPDPIAALGKVRSSNRCLQEFVPLWESLEWELSVHHWNRAGLLPFIEDDVPFLINNSGRLSEHAASLLFAHCEGNPPGGPIEILELGAGTGLFARYFLDAFEAICEQEHRDYYQRLVYYVSDQSPRTVEQWRERGQFEDHGPDRVRIGCVDALEPSRFRTPGEQPIGLRNLQGIFCNYILDVLPATVIRKGANGVEELRIRTHLTEDDALLAQYTRQSPKEVAELARSGDGQKRAELSPLISLLEFETSFVPLSETVSYCREALAHAGGNDRIVLNHGALRCLDACRAVLEDGGFVLINDYGPVSDDQLEGHSASQRFGPTSALGLNFLLLERHFSANGIVVEKPCNDADRPIHARLWMPQPRESTIQAFHNRFGPDGYDFFEQPLDEARRHVEGGRKNEALDCYRIALTRSPTDWQVAGEIAEFVGLHLRDYSAGRTLVCAAIDRNPWYSPWLWNVLGDLLFLDGSFADAHQAYLQALRIHPRDARGNLNIAFTYFEFGDYQKALEAVAVSLAADVRGIYRANLLEKQQQILGALSGRFLGEQERLIRRAQRML